MKLYEINESIASVMDKLEVDPDTGEITNSESVLAELDGLSQQRQEVLEWIAKEILNGRAEAEMLKTEEQRLKARRSAIEKKEEKLMSVLERECGGKKTNLGVATLSYRKTTKTIVYDDLLAIKFLEETERTYCLKYAKPEVRKTEVKALINSGTEVPGVSIVNDVSVSLK